MAIQTAPRVVVPARPAVDVLQAAAPLAIAGVLAVLLWSYWGTLTQLAGDWRSDDNYSVGALVPVAALYLLWQDRRRLARCRIAPSWWGLAVLLVAQAVRAAGLLMLYESLERYAFVLTIWGLVLLIGGRAVFRKTFWILVFLLLMVPLPGAVHDRISPPLQRVATVMAVMTLEMLGVVVTREGNTMLLNDRVPVAVAEACSGLRMLTAFVVVSAVFAYVVERPRWQKVTLILSSIPVAIFCNLVRLVVTALLFLSFSSDVAERFFHDFAGLTMMPMAILILVGELWLLNRLVIDDERELGKVRV